MCDHELYFWIWRKDFDPKLLRRVCIYCEEVLEIAKAGMSSQRAQQQSEECSQTTSG